MVLPRYLFRATKQYMGRCTLIQNNVAPSCCQFRHKYSTNTPRKFTNRHEWVTIENDIGTVGISQYAQESLGDVVFAQLPDPGTQINAGDECGALESVKAASEIYTPLSGEITEKNKSVEDKPGLINSSCYGEGWLFKLKITKPEELKDLMDQDKYDEFLKSDEHKDH